MAPGKGLLVLAAISRDDTEKDIESMASKILKAKLWDDDTKEPPSRVGHTLCSLDRRYINPLKWRCSVQDIGGEVLCGERL